MKKLAFFLIYLTLGCTAHRGNINYDEAGVYSHDSAGNREFKDVGPVFAENSDFVWTSCDVVAKAAVRQMLEAAKSRGADTVYNVRFNSDSGLVSTPTCYKRWGWFILWGVGGLGPWMTTTSVEGIAARFDDKNKVSGIHIPDGADITKLAAEYVDSLESH